MQTLALIWSALLFVLSSGLIYYERFRKNKLIVGIAVILAIGSTVSFLYGISPGISPVRPAPVASGSEAEAVADEVETAADETTAAGRWGRECGWAGGETVTRCLARMRQSYPEREAVRIVFNSRGTRALLDENQPELAAQYFTVAIQNSDSPEATPERRLAGLG